MNGIRQDGRIGSTPMYFDTKSVGSCKGCYSLFNFKSCGGRERRHFTHSKGRQCNIRLALMKIGEQRERKGEKEGTVAAYLPLRPVAINGEDEARRLPSFHPDPFPVALMATGLRPFLFHYEQCTVCPIRPYRLACGARRACAALGFVPMHR